MNTTKNTRLQTNRANDLRDIVGGYDADDASLSRRFNMTVFTDTKAAEINDAHCNLTELAGVVRDKMASRKDRLPLLKLATFGDDRTDKGSLRHDGNLDRVTGVEVDYDRGEISPDEARDTLEANGIAGLVYTTPSHTDAEPRWRIICPLSRAKGPHLRARYVARLNGLFDGQLAGESFTDSQAFYFGGVESEPITYLTPGKNIDRLGNLDKGAIGRGGRDPADSDDGEAVKTGRPLSVISDALFSIPNDGTGPCNERDDWLRVIQALHFETDGSDAGLDLAQEWSAQHPSHDTKHLRRTFKSMGRSRRNPVTGFHILGLAQSGGWRDNDALRDMFDSDPDLPKEDKPQRRESSLTFRTPDQCADMETRRYIIKGLLAESDVAAVIGAPGVGKSLMAPRLAYAVAQGADVFGHRTRKGGVMYVASEDESGMRARITALRSDHGDADGFTLVGNVTSLFPGSADLKALRNAVKDRNPSLIVIDTLAMSFPGLDENSADGMGQVVAAARSLTVDGAGVILVHHDTKAGDGLPRGHSLLNGALDMSLYLSRDQNGNVIGKPSKNRNGSCDTQMAFRIGVRTLGVDEDGDDITTAIAEDLASDYEPPKTDRLSGSEKGAEEILKQLGETDGDTWRDAAMAGRIVSAADEPNNRRRAFNRAKEALIRKDRVVFEDGRYRLSGSIGRSEFDDALGSASANENPKPMASANDGTKKRGEIPYDDCI